MSETFEDLTAHSPVAQFYEGRSVFITGATGFMGKVLVEKLLRSTSVQSIYLLIRPKKGVATEARLNDLLSNRIFDELRSERPEQLKKVHAVQGDISEERLGLHAEDEDLLVKNVSVVFHSAATVRFDEEFTKAVSMNVRAVKSIIALCKKLKRLEALVHVSTAYCNCNLEKIHEKIYAEPASPEGIMQLCETMSAETLNSAQMTGKLIGDRPNTYTFTKALAENLLETEGKGLPISIIRPSIVSAAWREPMPGWVDNLNGPTGIIAGALKGILRTLLCGRHLKADLVPVDVPINQMICIAWRTATKPSSSIIVYNCTSGGVNPFRWGDFEAWGYEALLFYPSKEFFWYPGGSMRTNPYTHKLAQVMFHSVPAHLGDLALRLTNNKPFFVKITQKMHKATKVVEFFTTNEWEWTNDNTLSLCKEITEQDRNLFNFDLSQLHWPNYIKDYVKGVRQYVFKEDDASIPDSIVLLRKMYWLEKGLQIFMFLMFWRVLFTRLLPIETDL